LRTFFNHRSLIAASQTTNRASVMFVMHALYVAFDTGAHVSNLSVFVRIQKFPTEMLIGLSVLSSVFVLVFYAQIGIFNLLVSEGKLKGGKAVSENSGDGKEKDGDNKSKSDDGNKEKENSGKVKENIKLKKKQL